MIPFVNHLLILRYFDISSTTADAEGHETMANVLLRARRRGWQTEGVSWWAACDASFRELFGQGAVAVGAAMGHL